MGYYIIKYVLQGLLSYTNGLFKTEIHNSNSGHPMWIVTQSASQKVTYSCQDDLNKNHNLKYVCNSFK